MAANGQTVAGEQLTPDNPLLFLAANVLLE
jgi:hypothetical protein